MITTHLFLFYDGLSAIAGVPPEPVPEVAAQRFGGGPFWSKYGYDKAYDDIRDQELEDDEVDEIRAELAPNQLREVDDAVNDAAGALLRDERPAVFTDYEKAYQRILRGQKSIRKELRTAFAARRAFRAEVKRKVQMAEDDDFAVALLYLLDD